MVVGGTNGIVKVLDQEFQPISEWNLYTSKGDLDYHLVPLGQLRGFKSICVDKSNRKVSRPNLNHSL